MHKQKIKHNTRSLLLDNIRGFAVVLMIIFHLAYDLNSFNFIKINFFQDKFWYYFPRVIVFLFMFSAGISLHIVHYKGIKWKKFNRRALKLFLSAALISLSTYLIYPQYWIYFGTLHSILVCSYLSLIFIRANKFINFIFCLIVLFILLKNIHVPWITLNRPSLDYIPPFPWIGVMIFGFLSHQLNFLRIQLTSNKLTKALKFLGVHALTIYIIHQPIIFSIVYLLNKYLR